MKGRALIFILDGFGIGALPDVPTSEQSRHTLRSVVTRAPTKLPILQGLGLGNIAPDVLAPAIEPLAAHGRCAPLHPGADTYMGHQELMGGGLSLVEFLLMADAGPAIEAALVIRGHDVEPLTPGQPMLLVDGVAVVHDNIEAQPRLNINVTASLDDISFDDLTAIGQIVRAAVNVSRVIVVASRGFDVDDLRTHIVDRGEGQIGVDTPGLGVYSEHYQVRHLGLEFPIERQLPTRMRDAGGHVVLLGKAADVVRCEGAVAENHVATDEVIDATISHLDRIGHGLVVANIQETDLAGHEQDAARYSQVLELVDRRLPELLARIGADDVLLITADHGNDPSSRSSQHTREYVPLLAYSPSITSTDLGIRGSLSDVAATVAELFMLDALDAGTSFAKELTCSSK